MARILIVDDSMFTRKLTAAALREAGHQAIEADGAFQAFEQLAAQHADCVISDLYMPGLCGVEFLRELGRRAPATPIIVLSAEVASLQARACSDLRVHARLSKPLRREALIEALDGLLAPSSP